MLIHLCFIGRSAAPLSPPRSLRPHYLSHDGNIIAYLSTIIKSGEGVRFKTGESRDWQAAGRRGHRKRTKTPYRVVLSAHAAPRGMETRNDGKRLRACCHFPGSTPKHHSRERVRNSSRRR